MSARLAVAIALLAWLALGNVPEPTRMWRALFNAGHVPLFGVLALLTQGAFSRWRPLRGARENAARALATTAAIGILVQLLQGLSPQRSASMSDVARDLAGATAFLIGAAAWRNRRDWPRRQLRVAVAACGLLILVSTAELSRTAAVQWARARALPALARLDGSWWEGEVLVLQSATLITGPGGGWARLRLTPAAYPGLTLDEPYPDWRGFQFLDLRLASDLDAPLEVSIRVNDATHDNRYADRFNRTVMVTPGEHHVRLALDDIRRAPDGRDMDMSRIRTMILFVHGLDRPVELRIGAITLSH